MHILFRFIVVDYYCRRESLVLVSFPLLSLLLPSFPPECTFLTSSPSPLFAPPPLPPTSPPLPPPPFPPAPPATPPPHPSLILAELACSLLPGVGVRSPP